MPPSIYKSEIGRKKVLDLYETILKRWPITFSEITVQTPYGDTHIIKCGDEKLPPLVLLHGSSSNALTWMGEVAAYSKHFCIYAVDVIGEPGKSSETRPSLEDNSYAEWMSATLKGLNLPCVYLVGMSQGGWIALKYAISQPDTVKKLVLLSPGGVVPTYISFILKAILFSLLGQRGMEKLNAYVFGNVKVEKDVIDFMNVLMTNLIPRMDKEYIFSDEELAKLSMPTLFIGGDRDVIRPVIKIHVRLGKFLPKFTGVIIPDVGHVLINTTDRVVEFLV